VVESRVDGTVHPKRRRQFVCHHPPRRSHGVVADDDDDNDDDSLTTSNWNMTVQNGWKEAAGAVVCVTIGNPRNPPDCSIESVVKVETVPNVVVVVVVVDVVVVGDNVGTLDEPVHGGKGHGDGTNGYGWVWDTLAQPSFPEEVRCSLHQGASHCTCSCRLPIGRDPVVVVMLMVGTTAVVVVVGCFHQGRGVAVPTVDAVGNIADWTKRPIQVVKTLGRLENDGAVVVVVVVVVVAVIFVAVAVAAVAAAVVAVVAAAVVVVEVVCVVHDRGASLDLEMVAVVAIVIVIVEAVADGRVEADGTVMEPRRG
jgi:hypothetical protein